MAKFVTIGYGDQAGYDRTGASVRDAAHAHDARLRQAGVDMGVAGPPVPVRNYDAAGVTTADGPFMSSALPVAGVAIIEAATLAEAIEIVSRAPCAVARFTPTARAAPETLPLSRSSASKNLTFKSSKPTIPATP